MARLVRWCSTAVFLVSAASAWIVHAGAHGLILAVTMTNDPVNNAIQVYDTSTGALLQTLSAEGKGGDSGSARGVRQYNGELFAAVNNGSNTVAVFRRGGDRLTFDKLVTTTSAPVSVGFGNDHMYVAGATTIDSFTLHDNQVDQRDGTADLEFADGDGPPPIGGTSQVGVIDEHHLLVTLKNDPLQGTVDVVRLDDHGAVAGGAPDAVLAPANTLTPFGFAVYPDGTALVTLAHTSQVGLFRNGAFAAVIEAGQTADCWMTRAGKYVFTANTGSGTISRLIGTGDNVFVDSTAAARIPTGAPADIDTQAGVLGVIDHGAGQSHLTLFTYDVFGELTASGTPITLGVPNATGVAIMAPAGPPAY
jgi:DNA-binding beta-propeller fold protein YncE